MPEAPDQENSPRLTTARRRPHAPQTVALAAIALLVSSVTALSWSPGTAAASSTTRPCKGYMTGPGTGLGIIKLKVTGKVKCSTARVVARRFDKQIARGKENGTVHDTAHHAWRCRITEHATGTDPGYIPYTSVRCERGKRRVKFKLAS
jgi:hypothetical protein